MVYKEKAKIEIGIMPKLSNKFLKTLMKIICALSNSFCALLMGSQYIKEEILGLSI